MVITNCANFSVKLICGQLSFQHFQERREELLRRQMNRSKLNASGHSSFEIPNFFGFWPFFRLSRILLFMLGWSCYQILLLFGCPPLVTSQYCIISFLFLLLTLELFSLTGVAGSIGPPIKQVKNLPYACLKLFFLEHIQSNLPRGPIRAFISCY